MATNHLKPFACAENANICSEELWNAPELRATLERGFTSGIARSEQVNRAIAQGTSAGFAIGQLVTDFAQEDAGIDATALYSGFKKALEKFAREAVIDTIYPVGSVYISTVSTNPAELFGTGTWERIGAGRTLIDAGEKFTAGSVGGDDSHTLTINELPSHAHAGSTNTTGGHTHTRGTMNITGRIGNFNTYTSQVSANGAFYATTNGGFVGIKKGSWDNGQEIFIDAARNWSGSTSNNGNHSHTVTVGATGGSESFSIRNPYLAVYIWKRIS